MAVIFYFSSRPTSGVISADPLIRYYVFKSFHLIEYAVLGLTFYFAYQKFYPALFTAYLYACTDELHQLFTPGRSSRLSDTLIDLVGILIGLIIYQTFKKIKNSLN